MKYDFYLNPDQRTIDIYVSESSFPVVIKRLITRSPISRRSETKTKLRTPLLEKMLVDLFADEKLLYFYQRSELANIYEKAIDGYSINFTKLFSYAKRRDREQEIKYFLNNNMNHLLKDILDD